MIDEINEALRSELGSPTRFEVPFTMDGGIPVQFSPYALRTPTLVPGIGIVVRDRECLEDAFFGDYANLDVSLPTDDGVWADA